jgi:hypothetical protein
MGSEADGCDNVFGQRLNLVAIPGIPDLLDDILRCGVYLRHLCYGISWCRVLEKPL